MQGKIQVDDFLLLLKYRPLAHIELLKKLLDLILQLAIQMGLVLELCVKFVDSILRGGGFDFRDAFSLRGGRILLEAHSFARRGIGRKPILYISGSFCGTLRGPLALQLHYSEDQPLYLPFVGVEFVTDFIV